jgi:A/G-specific adenine glycosylase
LPNQKWLHKALLAWWESNRRNFPWREDLDPFHLLVAEVLLQQTPAWKVGPAYTELIRRWPSATALAAAPVDEVTSVIRPLGLIARGPRLVRLASAVAAMGRVPREVKDLSGLPGVGEYVAKAVRVFSFGESDGLVDNVSGRVLRRFFGLAEEGEPARDPKIWELARGIASHGLPREVSWATLDLAASVCLPRRPRCGCCPLVRKCRGRQIGGPLSNDSASERLAHLER